MIRKMDERELGFFGNIEDSPHRIATADEVDPHIIRNWHTYLLANPREGRRDAPYRFAFTELRKETQSRLNGDYSRNRGYFVYESDLLKEALRLALLTDRDSSAGT